MNQQLTHAFNLIRGSDNKSVKQGEYEIEKLRKQTTYPLALLNYMNNTQMQTQLQAAIQIKIWCQSYMNMEQYERNVYSSIIREFKDNIVNAYFQFSKQISQTLRPGIVSISAVQFPDNWEHLFPKIMQATKTNTGYIQPFLLLVDGITEKYTYSTRSDPLYKQIIMVCDQVHDYLLTLVQSIFGYCQNGNQGSLQVLNALLKVFYNLNYQDLHPKFEDNLKTWMKVLGQILKLPHKSAQDQTFKCKGSALQSVLLYASKYKQDVQNDIKTFSSSIWDLCSNAGTDPDNDEVVLRCLKYFKSLVLWNDMKDFFNVNLDALLASLIIPNISPNQNTHDLFMEQNQTYIAYNFKNSQIGTRCAAAIQLLRTIVRGFPKFETFLISQMNGYLQNDKNQKKTMTLLTLIIQASSKAFRQVDGTTQLFLTNQKLIEEVYYKVIKPIFMQFFDFIMKNPNSFIQQKYDPLYISTILRFVFYFRIYLPKNELPLILKFTSLINSQLQQLNNVLNIVVVAFLSIRHGNFIIYGNLQNYFNGQNLGQYIVDVFKLVHRNDLKSAKLSEGLTTILEISTNILDSSCVKYYQYYEVLFSSMLNKTQMYDFKSAHHLFQALGKVSYHLLSTQSQNSQKLQKIIVQNFYLALKRQSDLLNFYLQLLSLYAYYYSNEKLSQYTNIYESILDASNWSEQNLSVMSSYTKYITIYSRKNPQKLLQNKQKIQTIMLKLVSYQRFQLFFRLLDSILFITDLKGFSETGYLSLAMQGSQVISDKSVQGLKASLIFFFKILYFYNTKEAFAYIFHIDNNFIFNLLGKSEDIIKTMQNRIQKKLMFGAICKMISEGCINNGSIVASLINSLIDNTSCRFSRANLSQLIKNNEESMKKQSSFQKLSVLSKIEGGRNEGIDFDEEVVLLQTYQFVSNNGKDIMNMISQKNQERMIRILERNNTRR